MTTSDVRRRLDDLDPRARAAQRSLVDAVRQLSLAAGTTALDPEAVAEAATTVADLARDLAKEATPRVTRWSFEAPHARALAGEPVLINEMNAALPPIEVTFGGDRAALLDGRLTGFTARAELVLDASYEGPPGSVHGGTSAFLMDCILGILVQATGIPAVTGTLDTRYLRRTPLDRPVVLHSRIVGRSGRKIETEGWVEHDGIRTVEARGLFIEFER